MRKLPENEVNRISVFGLKKFITVVRQKEMERAKENLISLIR